MPADVWSLIDTAGLAALDRGPRPGVASAATIRRILAPVLTGMDEERRDAGLSLALLWHDDLDGAHHLCQAHEGHPECDYVHALLHRREGDFGNAKYWFREVGKHPAYSAAVDAARRLGRQDLVDGTQWRPAVMVDACSAARSDATVQQTLMQVQAAEFRALAAHIGTV